MTLEEMLDKPVGGTKVKSLTNEAYKELSEKRNSEIMKIMRGYTEALKKASNIFVR